MVRSGRLLLFLLVLVFSAGKLYAANTEEDRAFQVAMDKFSVPWLAERDLAAFVQKYPFSPRIPEVIFYQAQARLLSGQAAGAIELLSTNQAHAGPLAPQYVYWLGIAQSQNNEATNASRTFDQVWRTYSNSPVALEAMIHEAALFAHLKNWASVVQLLEQSDGPFQKVVREKQKREMIATGYLLLGEARLAQNDLGAVDKVLQALSAQPLSADLKWQQEYLACRKQRAAGQLEHALLDSADLLNTEDLTNRAIGFDFKAGVLEQMTNGSDQEQMTNLAAAVAAYTNNLAAAVPPELQQRAVLKITELDLKQPNGLTNAVQTLSRFLVQFPQSSAADQAMLVLGELRLKQALAGTDTNLTGGETNLFAKALDEFDLLTIRFPNSPLVGKAYLDRGWCFWSWQEIAEKANDFSGALTNYTLSQTAFSNAAVRLPFSEDQAEARFKWADCQLELSNFVEAVANYGYVVSNYASLPEAQTHNLIERALYQSMQAALGETNLAAVTNALDKLLVLFPNTYFGPSSLLLAGQGLVDRGDPAQARRLFGEFERMYPTNDRIPEIRLAIARSFEKQGDWESAITNYSNWVDSFPSNALIAQVKFNLAQANDKAGHETNALVLFTNFVAQFPMDALAAHAQYRVGDFYWRQRDWINAEKNYQLVQNTNWMAESVTNLTLTNLLPRAQLMAGKAAMARTAYKQAIGYFTNLLSSDCATNLKLEATFAYADARISQDSTNKIADLKEAIRSLTTITDTQPDTSEAALAWGEIGNCFFQWGASDAGQYTNALPAYRAVIENRAALSETRGEARFQIGDTLEKQAGQKTGAEQTELLKAALSQYLDAFYQSLHDPDKPSPVWIEKSALAAGQLAESMQEWQPALCIYNELKTLLPVMAPQCDIKIAKAIEHGASLERCPF
jgi:outer membrane protein assembly factor BamD (BamD/ComL family)